MDDVKAKIRKLLALGQSPNEHEAAIAMSKAAELMMRYNLEQTDLGEQSSMTDGDLLDNDERRFHRPIASAIAATCGCVCYYTTRELAAFRFIGKPMNVETATAMYRFVIEQLDGIYKSHLPKGMSKTERAQWRREFRVGIARGVVHRIMSINASVSAQPGKNALVVHKDQDLKEAMDHMMNTRQAAPLDTSMPVVRPTAGSMQGILASEQVRIQNEIK
jgi:hypothetical protein